MKFIFATTLVVLLFPAFAQNTIGPGEQPQSTLDDSGRLRLIYGDKNSIYYATSSDGGKTFSQPTLVADVPGLHLGMSRGPQLATSKDYSFVTAMDKKGNIQAFRLSHQSGKWQKIENVNDIEGSAPEGLMSIAADEKNNFYAVWLDLREGHQNNISFATLKKGNGRWSTNKFIYKSPDGHVCECCKPSIAVRGDRVSIMFRNWLKGSRDLYVVTSADAGNTFSNGVKLGIGTWQLNGCPMDGGAITVDSKNNIHTVWQREGVVYSNDPGTPEQKIAVGRGVGMNGNIVHWEKDSNLFVKKLNEEPRKIGKGTALNVLELDDHTLFVVWELDKTIVFQKI